MVKQEDTTSPEGTETWSSQVQVNLIQQKTCTAVIGQFVAADLIIQEDLNPFVCALIEIQFIFV